MKKKRKKFIPMEESALHKALGKAGVDFMETPGSSDIAAIAYNNETLTLGVLFSKGTIYHHYGFSPTNWLDFKVAPSKGQHYARFIKPFFKHKLIDVTEEEVAGQA